MFVDVNIVAFICRLGLAKEDEIFKKKDTSHAFLLPKENCELILANQLTLLFQIHLREDKTVRGLMLLPRCVSDGTVLFGNSRHTP